MRELETMTPSIQPKFSDELIAPRTVPEDSAPRYRVALLTGCAQDLIFSDVNLDTLEVLKKNGCEIVTPTNQPCCGSLHAHNGEWEAAKDLARRQIELLPPESFDAIITNAAGCGSHLKHYSSLLKDDERYCGRAAEWDRKVKDIHEWLVEIEFRVPDESSSERHHVTYHEACHLCHGQKITMQPRQILKAIPGLSLSELPESDWCCGSAGIYNIVQPEMANKLLDRKLSHIDSTGATTVATGNPGCLLHIQNGVRQQGKDLRLAHPVSLLAEAYRRETAKT